MNKVVIKILYSDYTCFYTNCVGYANYISSNFRSL